MLGAYRADASWDAAELVARLETMGSGAAFKRLGFLVETLGLDAPTLVDTALDHRSAGVVRLDPDVPGKGRLTKRWGLWVNARVDGQEDLA
jgi:predicted transcriptional regulator of viral defense system